MNPIKLFLVSIDDLLTKAFHLNFVCPKRVHRNATVTYSQIGYRISFNERISSFMKSASHSTEVKSAVIQSTAPLIGEGLEICIED
jgi:hypothetical protein